MEHTHSRDANDNGQSWLSSRTGIVTMVVVSVLGFLIYEGHGAHLLGYAPFLLILACPLMHIFMHGGHGGHGAHQHGGDEENAPRAPEAQQPSANIPQAADTQNPGQQASNSNQPQHQHKGGCH